MGILNKITRKKIGAVSFFLLIIYGCVVLYFVLFSDRLGRDDMSGKRISGLTNLPTAVPPSIYNMCLDLAIL